MAKGQQRSNKETKKPKQPKKLSTPVAGSVVLRLPADGGHLDANGLVVLAAFDPHLDLLRAAPRIDGRRSAAVRARGHELFRVDPVDTGYNPFVPPQHGRT